MWQGVSPLLDAEHDHHAVNRRLAASAELDERRRDAHAIRRRNPPRLDSRLECPGLETQDHIREPRQYTITRDLHVAGGEREAPGQVVGARTRYLLEYL